MATVAVNEIEKRFAHLPAADQLILLERLVEHFRVGPVGKRGLDEQPLDVAALSPDLQRELARLTEQFRAVQSDQLNEVW
ncbi:MAG: hypothetical protein EXS35_07580 [Pedosphaera sp.]|nr:hypothetical protein [Pedosphaera sp.]